MRKINVQQLSDVKLFGRLVLMVFIQLECVFLDSEMNTRNSLFFFNQNTKDCISTNQAFTSDLLNNMPNVYYIHREYINNVNPQKYIAST